MNQSFVSFEPCVALLVSTIAISAHRPSSAATRSTQPPSTGPLAPHFEPALDEEHRRGHEVIDHMPWCSMTTQADGFVPTSAAASVSFSTPSHPTLSGETVAGVRIMARSEDSNDDSTRWNVLLPGRSAVRRQCFPTNIHGVADRV